MGEWVSIVLLARHLSLIVSSCLVRCWSRMRFILGEISSKLSLEILSILSLFMWTYVSGLVQ